MRSGSEILLESTNWEHENDFLDLKNLKNLVRHGEGQRLEFKMKVKFPEKIIKELVAFANTEGGHLFIGVSDAGVIEGVKFAEEEQFLLERAISDYCFTAFTYRSYRIHLDNGREVLVYQIYESVDKPHFVQLTQPNSIHQPILQEFLLKNPNPRIHNIHPCHQKTGQQTTYLLQGKKQLQ